MPGNGTCNSAIQNGKSNELNPHSSSRSRAGVAYLVIALIWAITRAYPVISAEPLSHWDIWEPKKLLDYGFFKREGAIINVHYMTGLLPNPERFNYVNHPYPMLWLNTLAFHLAGPWGCLLFNSLLGLLACLAVFAALQTFCSYKESLFGAVLYTLAPSTILFDVNPNISGAGAIIWPFVFLTIGKARESRRMIWPILLGLTVFLSGQISWSVYSVFPVLLCAAAGLAWQQKRWRLEMDRRLIIAVLIGSALTVALFLTQIVYYTYDFKSLFDYASRQAGHETGVSTAKMYWAISARTVLSVGPALLLATAVGLCNKLKGRTLNWPEMSALTYPLIFLAWSLLMRRYFFRELHLYEYLIFPLTVIAATSFSLERSRRMAAVIMVIAALSVSYPWLQASIPLRSATATKLGEFVRSISQSEQIIASNLERQRFPFQNWDVGGIESVAITADRLFRNSITTRQQLEDMVQVFNTDDLDMIFLYSPESPADPDLLLLLDAKAQINTYKFVIPAELKTPVAALRSVYWRIVGKHQVVVSARSAIEIELRVYRFRLKRKDGHIEMQTPDHASVSPIPSLACQDFPWDNLF